jgi:acyl carrier protein
MTRSELETEIRETLARLTGKDTSTIPTDADLEDAIGIDSLGRLELLAEVEERFDLLLDDIDMKEAKSIDGIIVIAARNLPQFRLEAK